MHNQYEPAATLANQLLHDHVVSRIWERDIAVWHAAPASADARSIASRLGWLDVAHTMAPHLDRLAALGAAAKEERIEAVYLLGMGGSSLCAEVLRSVYGIADGHPELFVLDTTDERTITSAASRMNPARTWFLVASKSGGTVEVASMERFFWDRLSVALGDAAGRHFIAITDPGTALQQLAESRRYREVFINPPDIGGRFSALSLFGLVPSAIIGAPVGDILAGGRAMAEGCRQENHANAGLELGAFIGSAVKNGRDKLTVALSPTLASLGLWIEQLVAESTGKHGTGALPVVDEPLGRPDDYGNDRAFVAVATERDAPDDDGLAALEAAGHPVLRLTTRDGRPGRGVLQMGIRNGDRGRRARDQSLRRAERLGSEGENKGATGRLRENWRAAGTRAGRNRRRRVGLQQPFCRGLSVRRAGLDDSLDLAWQLPRVPVVPAARQ